MQNWISWTLVALIFVLSMESAKLKLGKLSTKPLKGSVFTKNIDSAKKKNKLECVDCTQISKYNRKIVTINGNITVLEKRLPKVFIIGAAKCGTSAIQMFLSKHSQVESTVMETSPVLETHFFDFKYKPSHRLKSLLSYCKMLPFLTQNQISLDKTAGYLYSTQAPNRILRHVPDAKFIQGGLFKKFLFF